MDAFISERQCGRALAQFAAPTPRDLSRPSWMRPCPGSDIPMWGTTAGNTRLRRERLAERPEMNLRAQNRKPGKPGWSDGPGESGSDQHNPTRDAGPARDVLRDV